MMQLTRSQARRFHLEMRTEVKIFVLMGHLECEYDMVIGVYSSEKLASTAREEYRVSRKNVKFTDFDRYSVERFNLDDVD